MESSDIQFWNEPEAILYIVVPKTVELKYAFSIPHYKT